MFIALKQTKGGPLSSGTPFLPIIIIVVGIVIVVGGGGAIVVVVVGGGGAAAAAAADDDDDAAVVVVVVVTGTLCLKQNIYFTFLEFVFCLQNWVPN